MNNKCGSVPSVTAPGWGGGFRAGGGEGGWLRGRGGEVGRGGGEGRGGGNERRVGGEWCGVRGAWGGGEGGRWGGGGGGGGGQWLCSFDRQQSCLRAQFLSINNISRGERAEVGQMFYIYIYAFSRHFNPKRLPKSQREEP